MSNNKTSQKVSIIATSAVVVTGLLMISWFGYSKIKQQKLPPGLVALWSNGNATDSVGEIRGTLPKSAQFRDGGSGEGYVFDGNKGSGVALGNPPSLQLQTFTIAARIKRGSDSTVSHGSGGVGTIFGCGWGGYILYMGADGELLFNRLGEAVPQRGPKITDTNSHHVALTKSENEAVFYLDGVPYPVSYSGTFTFTTSIGIGYRPDNQDNSFLGTLDKIGVFNRALSAKEIQALYKDLK